MSAERNEIGQFVVGWEGGPGRNTKYEPWMDEQAHRLALLGLSDDEIAEALGIHRDTFYSWMREKPQFSDAVHGGKVIADGRVAQALFKRATGMVVVSEKAFKNKEGEIVVAQTKTELPPDTGAASNWLANRQRSRWGSYAEQDQERKRQALKGASQEQLGGISKSDLQARIEELERRRGEGA